MVTTLIFLKLPTQKFFAQEIQIHLAQLQLLNGMQTNANLPGVEKLVACELQTSWLEGPPLVLTSTELGVPELMSPGEVFIVKGWNRSVCFLTILYACYTCDGLLEAGYSLYVCWSNFSI